MTDEIHTTQTDPTGPKRGGRKAGSPAPGGDVAAGVPELDQPLTANEGWQGIGPSHRAGSVRLPGEGRPDDHEGRRGLVRRGRCLRRAGA